jgi:hypothetical protein
MKGVEISRLVSGMAFERRTLGHVGNDDSIHAERSSRVRRCDPLGVRMIASSLGAGCAAIKEIAYNDLEVPKIN